MSRIASEPPTQLLTFTCPHCHDENILKVKRTLNFGQVAAHEIKCVHCGKLWSQVLPGPVWAGPFPKPRKAGKPSRKRVSKDHVALVANAQSLTKEPSEAVLMLRLGAAINAIRAAQRMTQLSRKTTGMVGLKDLVWTFTMAAAQLKEAIDSLLKENYQTITEHARQGGASEEELDRLKALTDDHPDSLYMRVLRATRDRITYHWDKEPFEAWRARQTGNSVVWTLAEGTREKHVLQVAAAEAITEAIIPDADYQELSLRVAQVARASGTITAVFQFAIMGYVAKYEEEVSKYPSTPIQG